VSSIVNPDKLRHLGPVADLGALLHKRSKSFSSGIVRAGVRRGTG
jgi:hypothetical protein